MGASELLESESENGSGGGEGSERGGEEEEEEGKGKTIRVKVKSERKREEDVFVNIDPDVPLRWLFIRYCELFRLNSSTTRFLLNGACLREFDTPRQLSMVDSDVIFVFPPIDDEGGEEERAPAQYTTVCIRTHKERDTFLRVRRSLPILNQLWRGLSECGPQEEGSTCFVYIGMKLTLDETAEELEIEDGDVIDAFDFDKNSSSLTIKNSHISLKVVSRGGKETFYKMRRDTPIEKLILMYCRRESCNSAALFYEGRQLGPDDTAEELQMEDGDEIKAYSM